MVKSEDFLETHFDHSTMNRPSFRTLFLGILAIVAAVGFSACTVDENAALLTKNSASGSKTKSQSSSVKTEDKDLPSWSERMAEAKAEREKRAAEAEKKRQQELAAKKKADEAKARKLAAEKKKEEAEKKALAAKEAREEAAKKKAEEDRKKALAEKRARDEAAREKAKAEELARKKAEEEKRREAKIAARKKAEEEREARQRAEELAQNAERSRSSGGGFFSRLGTSSSQYNSKGHDVYVNRMALSSLSPSNAKIEVDLSEQKARVYKTGGGVKQLVIETQVSTGKSGHTTPTGSYRIQEKKVEKRSTLYGSWHNSSGAAVRSSGEAWNRPAGGSRFVGAEMPYWMRVNGGIGMHVGYVPDYPASHGCIRVPSAVQPLIFSKVGVGTQVTIIN